MLALPFRLRPAAPLAIGVLILGLLAMGLAWLRRSPTQGLHDHYGRLIGGAAPLLQCEIYELAELLFS